MGSDECFARSERRYDLSFLMPKTLIYGGGEDRDTSVFFMLRII